MTEDAVNKLLDDIRMLNGDHHALVQRVRTLVKKVLPSVTEDVKYGGILFADGDHFCGVFAYKKHVSVEFSHGAQINDTPGHLEGKGMHRRHVKLFSAQDIEAKELEAYVSSALEAARAAD